MQVREVLAQGGKQELRFGPWAAQPAVRAAQSTGPLPREQGSYSSCSARKRWTLAYSLPGLVCCYSAEMAKEAAAEEIVRQHTSRTALER